jgi:hypothetical protein
MQKTAMNEISWEHIGDDGVSLSGSSKGVRLCAACRTATASGAGGGIKAFYDEGRMLKVPEW